MKKMVAMVALAAALMIGGSARAATVDIFVTQTGLGSQNWAISAIALAGVGQIALVAVGFSGMTLEPLAGISALDSGRDPSSGNLTITSPAGVNLIPLGALTTIATLNGGPTSCLPGGAAAAPRCGVSDGTDAFGFTVLNTALDDTLDYSLTVTSVAPPVPEPTTTVLLGLGLACLAMARRSA